MIAKPFGTLIQNVESQELFFWNYLCWQIKLNTSIKCHIKACCHEAAVGVVEKYEDNKRKGI